MSIVAAGLVALVALIHVYILVLEMFLWRHRAAGRRSGRRPSRPRRWPRWPRTRVCTTGSSRPVSLLSAWCSRSRRAFSFKVFFLGLRDRRRVYGGLTVSRRILVVQALPAALALVAVLLARLTAGPTRADHDAGARPARAASRRDAPRAPVRPDVRRRGRGRGPRARPRDRRRPPASKGSSAISLVFFGIWWAWMNFTWFASAFDCDDAPLSRPDDGPDGRRAGPRGRRRAGVPGRRLRDRGRRLRAHAHRPRGAMAARRRSGAGVSGDGASVRDPDRRRPARCGSSGSRCRPKSSVVGIPRARDRRAADPASGRNAAHDALASPSHRRAVRAVHDHRPRRERAGRDDRVHRRQDGGRACRSTLVVVAASALVLLFALLVAVLPGVGRPGAGAHRPTSASSGATGTSSCSPSLAAIGAGIEVVDRGDHPRGRRVTVPGRLQRRPPGRHLSRSSCGPSIRACGSRGRCPR